MADGLYEEFRNGILGNGAHAQPDLDTNDIRAVLRDEGALALNLTTHVDFTDIATGIADVSWESAALTGKTVGTAGVGAFDHADATLSAVQGPTTVESIDYYDFQTAVDATSPLLWNLDTWTGLPLTPNGGDVILAPAAGGVFQLLGAA